MAAHPTGLTGGLKQEKGSAMVEAAILFPLVLLTLAALVVILVALYEEAAQSAGLHRQLLWESGAATKSFQPAAIPPGTVDAETKLGFFGIHPVREGFACTERRGFGILAAPQPFRSESRAYLLDEQKYLMLKKLGKEALDAGTTEP
jgi:hypothetical protein